MRHVLAYLFLVVLPLTGLLVVLRQGDRIEAPIAVHGAYAVRDVPADAPACVGHLLASSDSSLLIVQSGPRVTVKFGRAANVTLDGTLSRDTLTASGVLPPAAAPDSVSCVPGSVIAIHAIVRRDDQTKRLEGRVDDTPFTATRAVGYTGRRRS